MGENAGGKSNFIKSLQYLKKFFKENNEVQATVEYINDDYTAKLSEMRYKDTAQSFSLKVLVNGVIYVYDLEIDFLGIKFEKLEVLKEHGTKSQTIFSASRTKENPSLNDFIRNPNEFYFYEFAYDVKIISFKENRTIEDNESISLYVSRYALLGVSEAINFVKWMNNTLLVETAIYEKSDANRDEWRIINDNRFLEILRIIDPSIVEIKPNNQRSYQETVITRRNAEGKIFSRELREDSTGLREYFAWAVQIFRVVYEDRVLFADELDRSLNPILADKILSLINGSEHHGQFIFTTHNVLHLNLDAYMKEQIYFVTKDVGTLHSEMYSLAEFSNVEYNSGINLYEFYLRGVLGGTLSE